MRKLAPVLLLSFLAVLGCGSSVLPSVSIFPNGAQYVDVGQSITLYATVKNDPTSAGVIWQLTGAGFLSNQTPTSVQYTIPAPVAPATLTTPGSATVTATPVENQKTSASILLNYSTAPAVATTTLPNASFNTAYSFQLVSSGGSGAINWAVVSGGLPAGLALSSSGLISGTPTVAGTANFAVTATDSASTPIVITTSLALKVVAPTLSITSTSLANATIAQPYTATIASTGGIAPITWVLTSGTLPNGLSLSTSGVITGTPTAAGTSTFTVQVTDTEQVPQTVSKSFSIFIPAQLAITAATLPGGSVKDAYTATLQSTGGTPAVSWSIATGSLPAGLNLSATGTISGTPTTPGTSSFTVKATDSGTPAQTATASFSINIVLSTLAITTTSLAQGTQGQPYSATLTSTGGNPPVTWSVSSGSLPPGLTLSAAGGISGTPTTVTTSSFTVQATDTTPASVTQALTLTIVALTPPSITTATLPAGNVGAPYSTTLAGTGGVLPYTWTISAGTLPPGLSLSTAGVLSGTPYIAASSTFTVQLKDSEATPVTATRQYTVAIGTTLASGASNSVLSGSYAFLVSGFQSGNTAGQVYGFGVVGSLSATGSGALTGIEDVNAPSGAQSSVAVTGSYMLNADNRGFMVLTANSITTVYVISASNLVSGVAQNIALTQFDNSTGTGSNATGIAMHQTTSTFAAATIKGTFVFGLKGESPCTSCATPVPLYGPLAAVGLFSGDGSAVLSAGTEDAAAYGQNYTGVSLSGSFTAPSTTTGRGTLKLNPSGTLFSAAPTDFTYVIVNANELLLLSTDTHASNALLYGDVQLQQQASYSATSLAGEAIGYESQASGGNGSSTYPNALNAILTELISATGSGTATLFQDANRAGTYAPSTMAAAITYTTASNGRTAITTGGASNEVLYLFNTGSGFALDQAATAAFPALIRYEPEVPSGVYPPLPQGSLAAGTLATPIPATVASGKAVFALHSGGIDASISGLLTETLDSSTPSGTLSYGQASASMLYAEDANGRNVVTTPPSTTPVAVIYAISATRAVSISTAGSTTPVVTVLQQ